MTTHVQSTRPVERTNEPIKAKPTPTPSINSSGVSGVAVYDQESDTVADSSVSVIQGPAPITTRSTSSLIMWIVGLIALIVLVFFLWQIFL